MHNYAKKRATKNVSVIWKTRVQKAFASEGRFIETARMIIPPPNMDRKPKNCLIKTIKPKMIILKVSPKQEKNIQHNSYSLK